MIIVFEPQRSDLAKPVLSIANGRLLNFGAPIAAPYLIGTVGATTKVLLPIGQNPSAEERFPASVDATSGAVPLPASPVLDTTATILSRAQWEWMLVRFRLHDVIAATMAAIDRAAVSDAERTAYANLYRAVHHSTFYRLTEVQRLVEAYSPVVQATVGRAVTADELAAAFAEAKRTPA
jgi:hypothetical protein